MPRGYPQADANPLREIFEKGACAYSKLPVEYSNVANDATETVAWLSGRASPSHGGGHRFKSCTAHHGAVVKTVITPACHAGGRGFESLPLRQLVQEGQSKADPLFFVQTALRSAWGCLSWQRSGPKEPLALPHPAAVGPSRSEPFREKDRGLLEQLNVKR